MILKLRGPELQTLNKVILSEIGGGGGWSENKTKVSPADHITTTSSSHHRGKQKRTRLMPITSGHSDCKVQISLDPCRCESRVAALVLLSVPQGEKQHSVYKGQRISWARTVASNSLILYSFSSFCTGLRPRLDRHSPLVMSSIDCCRS